MISLLPRKPYLATSKARFCKEKLFWNGTIYRNLLSEKFYVIVASFEKNFSSVGWYRAEKNRSVFGRYKRVGAKMPGKLMRKKDGGGRDMLIFEEVNYFFDSSSISKSYNASFAGILTHAFRTCLVMRGGVIANGTEGRMDF